jgi:hypothetical protein
VRAHQVDPAGREEHPRAIADAERGARTLRACVLEERVRPRFGCRRLDPRRFAAIHALEDTRFGRRQAKQAARTQAGTQAKPTVQA